MRLATFNVLHGASPEDGQVDLGRFLTAVAGLDADVLALQEVDRDQPRSGEADLATLAAEAMGAAHVRFAPAMLGVAGTGWRPGDPTAAGTGPAYGIALVSRLPVLAWHAVRLPVVRTPPPVPGRPQRPRRPSDTEQRVALWAVLADGAAVRTVVATHLTFARGWNVAQLNHLVRRVRGLPGPLVLLGDLNMGVRAARLATGYRPLAVAPTFPAAAPARQLDHALARRLPGPATGTAVRLGLSDHLALVVDLDEHR